MADFFSDLFDSITGQQSTPQQTIIPTDQLLSQTYGTMANTVAPGILAYNRALAPGLTDIQLGVEKQYDPNIAALRGATTKSILDELNLGGTLGEELQNQVITNALEGSAASGFGVGQGGRGLVARDLGLTSLDLAKSRRGEALGAVRSSPSLSSLYQPQGFISPGEVAGSIQGVQAAKDEYANLEEDIRRQNFSNLISTGFKIIGGVVGGVFGGPAGAQAGASAGGAVVQGSGVRGVNRGGGNGGGGSIFTSILSGIGGPNSGIGARSGANYVGADNPGAAYAGYA